VAGTVEFYRTKNEKCPVEEFIDSLSGKDAQKVLWVFRLVANLDRVPFQYLKKLVGTEDIWECRVPSATGAYRFFSFFFKENKLIITHGFSKKTQKTDQREIRRAERYRQDHFKRYKR
jgi:phage-related protein